MMKKNVKVILAILISALVVLLGVAVVLIVKFNKVASNKPVEEVKKENHLLFSFDSYEEITGAKVRFINSFGATSINKDKKFITEGDASWLLKPEGSYAKQNDYPSIQLNCVGSTFKTNNFAEFDTVLLDVYNDSEEEVKLRWGFTMNNVLGGTAEAQQEFVLAPKDWTTCVFDMTGEEFMYLYLKDYVAYMHLTVLRIKENREDSVPNIYVDNVRGHYTDAPYTSSTLDFDLKKGVTFEKSSDRYIFKETRKDDPLTYMPISRVAYEDTAVNPLDESCGKYALKGVATGRPYPGCTINFDSMYGDGKTLRFMMYVEVDPAKAKDVVFKAEGKESIPYPAYPGDYKANEWVEVHIPMSEFGESLYIFVNLCTVIDGKECSKFGDDTEVNIYFDNFVIEDTRGMFEKLKDGSYKLTNPYGMNYVTLDLQGEEYGGFKKGDYLAFDLDLKLKKKVTMWVLGDEQWGPGYEVIPAINGWEKQTIKVPFLKDWKYVQIYIRFDEGPFKDCGATISNICLFRESSRGFSKYNFEKGISFENKDQQDVLLDKTISTYNNDETYMPLKRMKYAATGIKASSAASGDYVMAGNATGRNYPAFTALFDKVYGEGNTLQFKMYVKVDPAKAEGKTFKVEGKDSASGGMFFTGYPSTMKANEWIDVYIPITTDISSMYFFLNLYDNGNKAENYRLFGNNAVTVYFDDFKIMNTKKNVEKTEDGDIILSNPYGDDFATVDLMGKDYGGFKRGDVLSFDFTLNRKELITMWILGDGKWGEGYETVPIHMQEVKGTKHIDITLARDWEYMNVYILYRGEGDYSDLKATLSNIEVTKIMDENGNVVMKNPNGLQEIAVTLYGSDFGGFRADSTLNFDLSTNIKSTISLYVLGNGDWGNAMQLESFTEVNKTINTEVTFNKDWDYVVVDIIYEGQADYSKYVATLCNISVTSAMNPDGSYDLKNPANSSFVYATLRGSHYGNFEKGETFTFTLDMNKEEKISMWVLGNGSWSSANKMKVLSDEVVNGKRTVTVKFTKNYDFVDIYIQYLGDGNYSGHIATLKDFKVK